MLRALHRNRESPNFEYLCENPELCGQRSELLFALCSNRASGSVQRDTCDHTVNTAFKKIKMRTAKGDEEVAKTVKWDDIKSKPLVNLKSHKSRQYRAVFDLSYVYHWQGDAIDYVKRADVT